MQNMQTEKNLESGKALVSLQARNEAEENVSLKTDIQSKTL